MIIERQLGPYLVQGDEPLARALAVIEANRARMAVVVDSGGLLLGTLSDGDVRRWMLHACGTSVDLAVPVSQVMNRAFTVAPFTAPRARIRSLLDQSITFVPLIDDYSRVVALAFDRTMTLRVGSHSIGEKAPVFVIAEIGINHNGRENLARELIDAAAESGADCAKFQMRDLASLYRGNGAATDYLEDLGSQYTREILNRFELPAETMRSLFDHCHNRGITPLCTPWDLQTVELLEQWGLPGYKIASADLTNHDLVRAVARTGMPVIMSTGMSSEAEIIESVRILRDEGVGFALLHANSTYPAPYSDVNLRYLDRLREIGGGPIGYSGHERGYHVAVAAVARGANIIEKHITLDQGMEGTDHAVSLLPIQFSMMVSQIRDVEVALGTSDERVPTQGEMMNRVTLAKSVVAARPIRPGESIMEDMLTIKGPGRGLQPNRRHQLVGRAARRPFAVGDFFYPSDLHDSNSEPRPYSFRRPWGVPVRYHDVSHMLRRCNPDFVEFHFSYKDLELKPEDHLQEVHSCGFATHSPDLFRGDHILDLAADDLEYRFRSISELQRVVDHTRTLAAWFPSTERPIIIVSMGGFSRKAPLSRSLRPMLYDRVIQSLSQIDASGVQLVAQTLPPFPWYMGGRLFCNLFVEPTELADFCNESGLDLCFDVSHSKLGANYSGASFAEWTDIIAPYAAHLHLVDAAGVDREGLQIGDGEIDWAVLARQLNELAPMKMFIPEIWQGHQNGGEGFWTALDRLERWF